MSMNKLSNSFKVCATCGLWGGSRKPEFGGWVSFDTSEKGRCCGGDFDGAQVNAMSSCPKWEMWAAIRK